MTGPGSSPPRSGLRAREVCDADHTCQPCSETLPCEGDLICFEGECVVCADDTDCSNDVPGATPVCNASHSACEPCAIDDDCESREETPACVTDEGDFEGSCQQCTPGELGNADICEAAGEVCNPDDYTCVECNAHPDCQEMSGDPTPACDAHDCVPCTDLDDGDEACADSTDGPACQPAGTDNEGECGECNDDTDCSGKTATPLCFEPAGTCEECVVNADCSVEKGGAYRFAK